MTRSIRCIVGAAFLLCSSCSSHEASAAETPQPALFDPARHMRVDEVRPGMTGYGLTVFSGTKIDKFSVEVISVLKNQMGPKHDVVLVRCHGGGLEHSGAIAGMSGSPIYLKDDKGNYRMIGAFALGWEYSKDPIAGVRPIEEMLQVSADASPAAAGETLAAPSHWNAMPLFKTTQSARPLQARSSAESVRLTRLALPLSIVGVDENFFAHVAPMIDRAGFKALQSGAAATAPADVGKTDLEPGSAIGLPIVTGDLDMSAIGTVTERLGNRVFAFGHEFNAEGAVDLPMGPGYIHTIIPAENISFKLGSLIRLDGAIHSDESVAIAGTVGKVPAMIPVDVTVRTPGRDQSETYHFQAIRHPKFTPMGITTAITSAIMGHSSLPSDFTIRYRIAMDFDGGESVTMRNTATSATQAQGLQRDLSMPLMLALQNPFGKAYPTKVSATFDVVRDVQESTLKAAVTDKDIYKPGDTVHLFVTSQRYQGDESTRALDFDLPDDLDEGNYILTVGDATRFVSDETRYSPYKFDVRNLHDVFNLIRQETDHSSQKLYVRLASHDAGVSIGRVPLKGLPDSRIRLLAQPGRADVMPFTPSIAKTFASDDAVNGSVDLQIVVSRTPEKVARPTGDAPPPPAAQPPQQTPQPLTGSPDDAG